MPVRWLSLALVIYDGPIGPVNRGRLPPERFWERFFAALFETEEAFAVGDRAVVRWVFRWDDRGGHVRRVDVMKVRDGKVGRGRRVPFSMGMVRLWTPSAARLIGVGTVSHSCQCWSGWPLAAIWNPSAFAGKVPLAFLKLWNLTRQFLERLACGESPRRLALDLEDHRALDHVHEARSRMSVIARRGARSDIGHPQVRLLSLHRGIGPQQLRALH